MSCTGGRYGHPRQRIQLRCIRAMMPAAPARSSRGRSTTVSRPVFCAGLRASADHRSDGDHVRVGRTRPPRARCSAAMRRRRHSGPALVGDDQPGVLRRQEALRHDDVQPTVAATSASRTASAPRAASPMQAAAIALRMPPPTRARSCARRARPLSSRRPQQAGAHHRRQRQRDHHRHHDAMVSTRANSWNSRPTTPCHEQQRDEDRDQRHGQRHHGEADLARALEAA